MDQVDTCVIGAGVVGLAVGMTLARQSEDDVLVIDAELEIGQGVSSRNSEVIHAGIYYPTGSLKARFCVEGKARLYDFCEAYRVPYQRCGKLIVATTEAEVATLEDIKQQAERNQVFDLQWWDRDDVLRLEPNVRAAAALFSPSTGIVSAHDLMRAYLGHLEAHGGLFVGGIRVGHIDRCDNGFEIDCTQADGQVYRFKTRKLVNAAGLGAQEIAETLDEPGFNVPLLHLCKGDYFTLSGKSPFKHLIYPVPEASGAGLGVHATLDLGGQVKFGPDVQYTDRMDYQVNPARRDAFAASIRRYFPGLDIDRLEPGYAGIRPKLQGPGEGVRDFEVMGPRETGVPGLVHLFGIESPGLTSSIAIAEHVAQLLSDT